MCQPLFYKAWNRSKTKADRIRSAVASLHLGIVNSRFTGYSPSENVYLTNTNAG
jgi:hypothetical protein